MIMNDEKWMQHAFALAQQAELAGEVPIGAVIVLNDEIIGQGRNSVITHSDPTAHAEMVALRQAGKKIQNYRLVDAALYTTLEPCCMCAGALVHARIKTLHFATSDPRAGACGSKFQLVDNDILNHKIQYNKGLLEQECSMLLKNFFKQRRIK
jgi:tRNA(adenine34) deaminase